MVRLLLLESCAPDWDWMVRMASDLEKQLYEDTLLLTEMLKHWLESCVCYQEWYTRACVDFSITAFD